MSQLSNNNHKGVYRRLSQYIIPFWPVLVLGIVANIFYSGIDAGFTYMLKPFMNKGFIDKDLAFIAWIPLMIVIGISARGIISSIASYCMTWVARNVVKVFRQSVFEHIIHLPASYYDKAPSGQLLSKILYDVEQVAQVSADALTTLVQSFFLLLGLLAVMFIISWQLSLLFLLTVPFIALIVQYTNKRIRRVSHALQQSMGNVTEIAGEAIDAYKEVKIFGGQFYELKRFNQAVEESRKRDMKVAMTKAYNVAGVQCVIAIGMSLIILLAIHLSNQINISPGGFLSIIAAMLQLVKPMKNLTTVNSVIQRGLAGAESIFNLLDQAIEIDAGKHTVTRVKGDIAYQGVSFVYPGESKAVLSNVSFSIKAGQTLALVGRSGSGKSTIASLLPRFYDVLEGVISIDGMNINSLSLASLRQQIALVSQDITLFNDTLANNIAYGTAHQCERDAIVQVAQSAHVMEFAKDLPQGLDTLVGENGVLLSGGQRQRIALARAILKDAPILILDEATSALDSESERLIQAALERIMTGRTTLVIAHRLSTIEAADQIIVMDKGQIIERGRHLELLTAQGHYASLHRMQSHVNDTVLASA